MIDKLLLKRSINSVLSEAGFLRKGSCWYLASPDVIALIALRKSDHGAYYYLDCGFSLKAISDVQQPKINHCHIQFNLNSLAADDSQIFITGLDLGLAKETDIGNLVALIKERCLPQVVEMSSVRGLRRRYLADGLKGALLFWEARKLLETVD